MNNEPNMNENIPQQTPEAPATKRCPVCGKDVDAQAAFCGECGYNFNAGTAYTLPPQPQAPAEDTSPLKMSDYLSELKNILHFRLHHNPRDKL